MLDTIGIIEFNSIAKGIEATDIALKSAEVTLIKSGTTCPGKFLLILSGNVESIKSAIKSGVEIGRENIVNSNYLPKINPKVIASLNGTTEIRGLNSLGILEFFDISSSIIAADELVKSSNVEILEIRTGYAIGGKSFITLTGDFSSVKTAIDVGAKIGEKNGTLVNKAVIASPKPELFNVLL